jgi:hypothetical protein
VSQDFSKMVKSRFGNSWAMPGHPRDRAIAAAMSIVRKYKRGGKVGLDTAVREAKKFASGGKLDETGLGNPANHIPHPLGMIDSAVPGRTDKLPVSVKAGSYVFPADIPSALGEGNSMAGRKILDRLISSYTAGAAAPDFTAGDDRDIPIVAAGGEYVVHPGHVLAIGGGSLTKGHDLLDGFVREVRRRHIKTLQGLPGPKTD